MSLLIILGVLCILIGLIGCVVPGIAGPPFSFLALIMLSIARSWEPFGTGFLVGMAIMTIVVQALDYIVPAAGARRFGASRAGFWGAVVGMLLGLAAAPPLGLVAGGFIGAFLGEVLTGKPAPAALRAGWGVFLGMLFGMVLKLIASGIMTFFFFRALI